MSIDPDHAAHIAFHHGIPERELVAASETDLGLVFTTTDGGEYVVVPADRPDFEGKTGLMFAKAPTPVSDPYGTGYVGSFPVYAHTPPAEDTTEAEPVAADSGPVDPLAGLTKAELLAYATEHKIEVDPKGKNVEVIRDEIAAALAAVVEGQS